MLIVWENKLLISDKDLLHCLDNRVRYWPRSWTPIEIELKVDPSSWWISFSSPNAGLIWMVKKPEFTRVIFNS